MSGIVRRIGWETHEETGEQVFRAVVEYPGGPDSLPSDMTVAVVWQAMPVEIVLVEAVGSSSAQEREA